QLSVRILLQDGRKLMKKVLANKVACKELNVFVIVLEPSSQHIHNLLSRNGNKFIKIATVSHKLIFRFIAWRVIQSRCSLGRRSYVSKKVIKHLTGEEHGHRCLKNCQSLFAKVFKIFLQRSLAVLVQYQFKDNAQEAGGKQRNREVLSEPIHLGICS